MSGPAPFTATLDLRVLAFTAGVALVSVVLFGVLPAWRTSRLDVVAILKAGARGISGAGARPARILVTAQVALSLVLVTATGLLARSFQNLLTVDVGFDREHLLSVGIEPRLSVANPRELPELQRRVLDRVRSLPEVSAASMAMCGLHVGCRAREDGFVIEGYQSAPNEQIVFLVNGVAPDYFSAVGMRLLAGRALDERDQPNTPKVAVVNKTLAMKYFKDGDAIGRRFGEGRLDTEIVGIVDEARLLNVKDAAVPTAFFSLRQRGLVARSLEIRTKGDPAAAVATVRRAIGETAPALIIESITPIDDRISASLTQERLVVFLASGFGALALGLAGFGLFGVLSYAVARRRSEFGIRMALGAARSQVLWSVIRDALWLVLCGFLIGAPLVFAARQLVHKLVFGVSPNDWSALVSATALLFVVGSICATFPALRASRIDPNVALRDE